MQFCKQGLNALQYLAVPQLRLQRDCTMFDMDSMLARVGTGTSSSSAQPRVNPDPECAQQMTSDHLQMPAHAYGTQQTRGQ